VPVPAAEVRLGHRAALRRHPGTRRLKWFKPAKGQFQIYYKLGTEQPEYIPDFVAEMDAFILWPRPRSATI
jgi:hypothetical protein